MRYNECCVYLKYFRVLLTISVNSLVLRQNLQIELQAPTWHYKRLGVEEDYKRNYCH